VKTPEPALLDMLGVAALLAVSESTIDRLIRRDGLPYLDLSARLPGRRQRRLLRFDREAVLAWVRSRSNRNGGAA
jgi:predicted DNA-binding transcriptional regulator AlpA